MREQSLRTLSLAEIEEASAELHRRIAVALRRVGERRADEQWEGGGSPRRAVASLAASTELAAATLAAIAAGGPPPEARSDEHPAAVAALMYAAPTLGALLSRLEQDRRLLASLARGLESRLAEEHASPWGRRPLQELVIEASLARPAQCAQALGVRADLADA